MKCRFWFGCPHEFSFPVRSSDGSCYQVCTLCGVEYGYDWKRMKRAKLLPRRVQQTSLDQCRPQLASPAVATATNTTAAQTAANRQQAPVPPMGRAGAMPESANEVQRSVCGRQRLQKSAIALSASYAEIWRVVRLVANAAKNWAAASKRCCFSSRWRICSVSVVAVMLFVLTYAVVHRPGRAVPLQQKRPEIAAPVEVATHSDTSIETAVGNNADSEAPPTPSETDRNNGGRKLHSIPRGQRVQTPVLVVGEALVNSDPDGAQVRFDGSSAPVFITPAVVGSVSPGHHSAVFSKPGFVSQTATLEVVAGVRSTVAVRLVQKGSVFNISSNPTGAVILLDSGSTALTSPAELRVGAIGTHTITLVQPGYLAARSQVSVKDGENFSVTFTLISAGNAAKSKVVGGIRRLLPGGSSKEMAEVQFKTNPKGARLMLNGWSAPKTTPLELRLPPGGYDVVIQADGFKRFSREIVLEAGQKIVLQEALEHSTGDDRPPVIP
jgi:hypothetical protein